MPSSLLYKIKNNRHVLNMMIRLRNPKAEDSILIFSESRGGSTWLMEQLSLLPGVIINWEPGHVTEGPIPKKYNLGWRIIIPEQYQGRNYRKLFKEILTLKRNSPWSLKKANFYTIRKGNRVLTKFVRANNLLPWLTANFKFKHKPILLVRHPVPTIFSQMKAFGYKNEPMRYEIPKVAHPELYQEYAKVFDLVDDKLSNLLANWCLSYIKVLNNSNNRWHVLFYEDLILNPDQSIQKLNEECNLSLKFSQERLDRASSTNFGGDLLMDKEAQLKKWMDKLNAEEKLKFQKILDGFGIKHYDLDNYLPIIKQ